jgi:uncharacterized membrane protein
MNKRFLTRFAFLALLAALGLLLGGGLSGKAQAFLGLFGGPRKVQPKNGEVRLSLDGMNDGKARHYVYASAKAEIPFFVVQSPDGVARAAFDACDVCFPARKGYSQDGGFMVCNNCGQRFHVSRVNEVKGGCNPAPLERRVDGGELVIRTADLDAGAAYFQGPAAQ